MSYRTPLIVYSIAVARASYCAIAPVFVPSLGFVLIPIVPSFSIPTFPIIVPPFSTSIVFIVPAFCIPYSFSPLPIAPIVPALSSELSTAPDSVDISYIAPVLYIAFVVPSIVSPFSMLRISVIVPAFSIPYSLLVALLLPVPSIAFCAPNDRLPPDSLFIPASVPSIVPSKLELPPSFICPMSPALSIP